MHANESCSILKWFGLWWYQPQKLIFFVALYCFYAESSTIKPKFHWYRNPTCNFLYLYFLCLKDYRNPGKIAHVALCCYRIPSWPYVRSVKFLEDIYVRQSEWNKFYSVCPHICRMFSQFTRYVFSSASKHVCQNISCKYGLIVLFGLSTFPY